jgi:1,4-dihydroxy-2-naphthoate octaprenyltransferase
MAVVKWGKWIVYFVRLGRPLFLAGGFVFHALGVVMALYAGASLKLSVLLWGQVAITSMQLMTHYSNDYFDLEVDRANQTATRWSGGSRVLPDGRLPPRVALVAAVLFALLALVATFVLGLVLPAGPFAVPLLLLALVLTWEYSAPPLRLHSRGMGELVGALVVSGLTPLAGFYLQQRALTRLPFLAVLPLCCLQFAMLLAVHFPDAEGDAATGKRTLVVRLGRARAARLYLAALATAYALLPVLVWAGLPPSVAGAIILSAPLAAWLAWRTAHAAWSEPAQWNSLAFWSIGLLMGTAVLETAAFLWLLSG